jgi:hypothetical protein
MRGSAAFRTGLAPGGVLAGPWVRNELWRQARAVPSLDLRFADNKSLVDATTGQNLVTFTRASSGTFVGSDGLIKTATTNEARFDHGPTTGESLGLLVEESRTNLLLQSEDFSTTWLQSNTNIATNTGTSPAGSSTADKIIANTTNGQHFRRQDVAITASTTYTLSVYAKADGYNFIAVSPGAFAIADYITWFDLSSGTIGTNTAGNTASIQSMGNGWYKCSVTRTTNVGQVTMSNRFYVCSADNVSSFEGDNASGLFLWGAQLEAGSFPTSYIPTTTATVTRSADVASISGSNFSGWFNATKGTIYGSMRTAATNSQQGAYWIFKEGVLARGIAGQLDTGDIAQRLTVYNRNDVSVGSLNAGTLIDNAEQRFSHAWESATQSATLNGSLATGSYNDIYPGIDALRIGVNEISAGSPTYLSGTIKRLTYWPTRLGNEVLQTITQ